MAHAELNDYAPAPAPTGALIELGDMTVAQARHNWWGTYRERGQSKRTAIRWQTAKIVKNILDQLESEGPVEVVTALMRVDKALLPDDASERTRQIHFDCCVEAVELTLGALRYTVKEMGEHTVHTLPDVDTRANLPAVQVAEAEAV